MGRLFIGQVGDILIRGRHIKSAIISPRTDFSWGRHFNVTPAVVLRVWRNVYSTSQEAQRQCHQRQTNKTNVFATTRQWRPRQTPQFLRTLQAVKLRPHLFIRTTRAATTTKDRQNWTRTAVHQPMVSGAEKRRGAENCSFLRQTAANFRQWVLKIFNFFC